MRRVNRFLKEIDCTGLEQDLLLYLHDSLSARSRARVESHVRRCRQCQQRLNAFALASEALAGVVREELPPWATPRQVATIWQRNMPWYTPLLVLMMLGGIGAVAVQYGAFDWMRMQAVYAPPATFREKLLVHRRLQPLLPNKENGNHCQPR